MVNRKGDENLESKIIIRGYPPETDEKDMRIMFEKYGKIEDCELASCGMG
jgi:RNA recognition motif-containing protein